MTKIRTRYAPSPTGRMHVGNLRSALYEFLIAKHDGGTFMLRIEDTDQERYVEGAVDIIYRTMEKTGMIHDEGPDKDGGVGPYVQSERMKTGIYMKYAKELVDKGEAYYCFCDKERLASLKTEVINCKTKQRTRVPHSQQIITPEAHEAIISLEQFERVQQIRSNRPCPANQQRYNLFRGKLFCECCGHPLTISRKQLKERVADIYLCMYHYSHPEICPKTHRVYHDMLYPYVLQEIQTFARSMKRRKVNSSIANYADIQELTPDVLDATIERIEIGHVGYKSRPGSVIHIYWKLR